MKKYGSMIAAIAIVLVTVAAWWYLYTTFLTAPTVATVETASTTGGLSGKAVSDSATVAKTLTPDVVKHGEVPVTANGLERDPRPLFTQSQQ